MNPLAYLRPAVYAALTSPALVLDGATVSVKAYGAGEGSAYVLLPPAQDTANKTNTNPRCQQWECTLLVDAVTLHPNTQLSVARADALADLLSARLDGNRLPLPQGLQVTRAAVENVNGADDSDGEQVDIHRYLRVRYSISLNS